MRRRAGAVSRTLAPALVCVVLAACTSSGPTDPTRTGSGVPSGPRPSSTAKLAIVSPRNGEVVHGSSVPVQVTLQGAKIVPLTTTQLQPNEGHLHLYLDDQLISMTAGTRTVIPNVKAGTHLLKVEFVATDHFPFDPRVIEAVTFTVQP